MKLINALRLAFITIKNYIDTTLPLKLDIHQGVANSGKIMGVDEEGNLVPVDNNIDLSDYETIESAQVKYDALTSNKADKEHNHSWNELNDRPFGEGLIEQSVAITDGEVSVRWDVYNFDFGDVCTTTDAPTVGDTYVITLNNETHKNETYECIAYIPEDEGDGNCAYIGNGSYYYYDGYGENVPFLVTVSFDEFYGVYRWWMRDAKDAGMMFHDFTTKIEHITKVEGLKQLDEKYIPSTIARTDYVDANFALKSEIPNIDVDSFETKENAQVKYDELTELAITQSDWNQNDETAIDYIKNRPFYDGVGYVELQSPVTLTFGSYNGVDNPTNVPLFTEGLVAGETYTVVWDGVNYEATAIETYSSGERVYMLGNGAHNGLTGEGDSTLPFYIATFAGLNNQVYSVYVNNEDVNKSHTFSILKKGFVTVQLDEKFIPSSIARITDIPDAFSGSWNDLKDKPFGEENKKEYLIKDLDLSTITQGSQGMGSVDIENITIAEGEAYYLEYAGKVYESAFVSWAIQFVDIPSPDYPDGWKMSFTFNPSTNKLMISSAFSENRNWEGMTASLYTEKLSVKTLDPKYLPDSAGGGFITEFIEEMNGFTVDGQHFETSHDLLSDSHVMSDEDFAKLWQICQNKVLIYRTQGVFPAEFLSCNVNSYGDDGKPNNIMLHTPASMSMTICTESGKGGW